MEDLSHWKIYRYSSIFENYARQAFLLYQLGSQVFDLVPIRHKNLYYN